MTGALLRQLDIIQQLCKPVGLLLAPATPRLPLHAMEYRAEKRSSRLRRGGLRSVCATKEINGHLQ